MIALLNYWFAISLVLKNMLLLMTDLEKVEHLNNYSKNTTTTVVTTTKPVASENNKSNKKKGNRKKSHAYNNACDDTQCTLFDDDMTGYPYNDPFYYNGY